MFIPDGFGQVTFMYEGAAVNYPAVNTLGIIQDAEMDPEQMAVSLGSLWGTQVLPRLTNQIRLSGVLVKYGPTESGPAATVPFNTPGGVSGDPFGANSAYLIRKNTASGGRRGKGRMYLPGVSESNVGLSGNVSSGQLTALATAMNAVWDAMNAADWGPVLLHSDEIGPSAITSFTPDPIIATQRRRLRR